MITCKWSGFTRDLGAHLSCGSEPACFSLPAPLSNAAADARVPANFHALECLAWPTEEGMMNAWMYEYPRGYLREHEALPDVFVGEAAIEGCSAGVRAGVSVCHACSKH